MSTGSQPRSRVVSGLIYTHLGLLGAALTLVILRFTLVPLLVYIRPSLDNWFYDHAFHGPYPKQYFHSSNLTWLSTRTTRWSPVCDAEHEGGALILLDVHGSGVKHRGPTITDLRGNLVWLDTSFGHQSMNLKVQQWRGEQYLTFWAGENNVGRFYMLDSSYKMVRNITAHGDDLPDGDLHEFLITRDDTALILVYSHTHTDMDMSATNISQARPDGYIVDEIIQELDLDSGDLLFQWKVSDHIGRNDPDYLKTTFEEEHHSQFTGRDKEEASDFYHLNSVDKDSKGNYLLSSRFTHSVMTISPAGEILWALGGKSNDFTDLSEGHATDLMWQHDARWVDEETGVLSIFDNGIRIGRPEGAFPWSRGRVMQLELANMTATHVHEYASAYHLRSIAQGSMQFVPGSMTATGSDQVMIGWGSAAAFSLHDYATEDVLCETHFAPSLFFEYGLVKSYRAVRAPGDWKAWPTWDPVAVMINKRIYVSWNGATEVVGWILQGSRRSRDTPGDLPPALGWEDVGTERREDFETCIELRNFGTGKEMFDFYRVAAIDADGSILRHSNNISASESSGFPLSWPWIFSGIACVITITIAIWLRYRRSGFLKSLRVREKPSSAEYIKLEPVDDEDDP